MDDNNNNNNNYKNNDKEYYLPQIPLIQLSYKAISDVALSFLKPISEVIISFY